MKKELSLTDIKKNNAAINNLFERLESIPVEELNVLIREISKEIDIRKKKTWQKDCDALIKTYDINDDFIVSFDNNQRDYIDKATSMANDIIQATDDVDFAIDTVCRFLGYSFTKQNKASKSELAKQQREASEALNDLRKEKQKYQDEIRPEIEARVRKELENYISRADETYEKAKHENEMAKLRLELVREKSE